MIGYPSGQDGAILPARDYPPCPARKFPRKPYNKSFIDQACSAKMAGYWPRSFFCVFMDLDSVSVHKHAKKELGQYPAILTHTWSVTHIYYVIKITCCKTRIHVLREAPFQINHAQASCSMCAKFCGHFRQYRFRFVLGRGTDSFERSLTCFIIRNDFPSLWDSAQIFQLPFGFGRSVSAVGQRRITVVLPSEACEAL